MAVFVNDLRFLHTHADTTFYDKVWLPYPYGWISDGVFSEYLRDSDDYNNTSGNADGPIARLQEAWSTKRSQLGPLFEQGILETLPPPIASVEVVPEGFTEALVRQMGYSEEHEQFRISDVISGKLALAIHAVYGKSPGPELFISNPTDATTARLAGFIVSSLFRYAVPQLSALSPEQILEVRKVLKDTKEGFTLRIYEAVEEVEQRLKSGDPSEVVAA